tara:strand:+ start:54 stop:446 length:393 start_codon:yes stop_codon:yes gene_type:complete
MPKQALEQIIMDSVGEILRLRFNPGSGSVRGDADLSPKDLISDFPLQLGFECKDHAVKSHSVNAADWKKAKVQIKGRSLDPIFVTRNKELEIMVHMELPLFKNLIEQIIDNYEESTYRYEMSKTISSSVE